MLELWSKGKGGPVCRRGFANRLRAIGLNPINNVVDITNYVLHSLGQPLHAFDMRQSGSEIIVKTCPDGTPFVTLDGVERKLSSQDLMICSADGPMCIAEFSEASNPE